MTEQAIGTAVEPGVSFANADADVQPDVARADAPAWSLVQRFSFRVVFLYVVLFFFPLPSGLAAPEFLSSVFDKVWQRVVPWAGKTFLGLQISTFTNGSGDTTYDWVRIGLFAVIAIVGGIVWSIVDRRRTNYATLHGWAHLFLRYALAISMVTYAASKVIKVQFPTPGYWRLTETYGESSPMGLLWAFMGFSTAYTFFAGACELVAGLLLFFRRTATAGALVTAAVMTNIAMLNFCYDVPVKIGSVHLLFASLLLVIPDLRRVFNAVILGRATGPANHPEPRLDKRATTLGFLLKLLIVVTIVTTQFQEAIAIKRQYGPRREPKPPNGWYLVSSQVRDGVELPVLATNNNRWKTFAMLGGYVRLSGFDRSTRLFKMDGDREDFALLKTDDMGEPVANAKPEGRLRFHLSAGGQATLQGTFEGHQINVTMQRENTRDFQLMKRGFHWVSEMPFNR